MTCQYRRLDVNGMVMLGWMCGATKKDKISNEHGSGSVKVTHAAMTIAGCRLKAYKHVKKKE